MPLFVLTLHHATTARSLGAILFHTFIVGVVVKWSTRMQTFFRVLKREGKEEARVICERRLANLHRENRKGVLECI